MIDENSVHDCEIQGAGTKYVSSIDVNTGQTSWICIWCEMAKKVKGDL